jgi:hypothetical protein
VLLAGWLVRFRGKARDSVCSIDRLIVFILSIKVALSLSQQFHSHMSDERQKALKSSLVALVGLD